MQAEVHCLPVGAGFYRREISARTGGMCLNRIYLDNAATTPVHEAVLREMLPWFTERYGNPSGIYETGREARRAVETAQKRSRPRFVVTPQKFSSHQAAPRATTGPSKVLPGAARVRVSTLLQAPLNTMPC